MGGKDINQKKQIQKDKSSSEKPLNGTANLSNLLPM